MEIEKYPEISEKEYEMAVWISGLSLYSKDLKEIADIMGKTPKETRDYYMDMVKAYNGRRYLPRPAENGLTKSKSVQRFFASILGVSILVIGIFIMIGITTLFPPTSGEGNDVPVNKASNVLVEQETKEVETGDFVASKNSDVFHRENCHYVDQIYKGNIVYYKNRESAIAAGKSPCSVCKP